MKPSRNKWKYKEKPEDDDFHNMMPIYYNVINLSFLYLYTNTKIVITPL